MNNYYFKKQKTIELLEKIKNELIKNRKNIEKAFKLDFKEWEVEIDFEKIISIIDIVEQKEYLPKFTKEEIVDGIGKIVLISNQNPYLIFNFILSSIYTNNKVDVLLENKMLASNKCIIETIIKTIKDLKLDLDTVEYIELVSKDKFIAIQDNYDLLYYFGNKEEYINFIKRIHIDTRYENFGEIYVYMDNKDFKEKLLDIDKFAYLNEINVEYFNTNFENSIEEINKNNNINKISVIFTKNIDKAYEFVKKVKAENVYINSNPCDEFKYETNISNLVYSKKIKIKK